MESFAFPDKCPDIENLKHFMKFHESIYGKLHRVMLCQLNGCNSPFLFLFLFLFNTTTLAIGSKWNPIMFKPKDPSTMVSFVRIDPADVKLPVNNPRVSNSVFKVRWSIYIVRRKA